MDRLLDVVIDLVVQFGGAIPIPEIPWDKLTSMMDFLMPHLIKANSLFPVDEIFQCLIVLGGIRIILVILWSVKFIRSMLPF